MLRTLREVINECKRERSQTQYKSFYESTLKRFGVSKVEELTQYQRSEFFKLLQEGESKKVQEKDEIKVKDKADLLKHLGNVFKSNFDEEKSKKVISDLSKKDEHKKDGKVDYTSIFFAITKDFDFKESLVEGKISSEKDFKKYAETIYKKAHGDKYDQKVVDKVIKDLMKKYDGNFGKMQGALTSGLGEEYNKDDKKNKELNERKSVKLKNKYRDRNEIRSGVYAPVRESILKFIDSKGVVSKNELIEYIARRNEESGGSFKTDKGFLQRNAKYFNTFKRNGQTFFEASDLGKRYLKKKTID